MHQFQFSEYDDQTAAKDDKVFFFPPSVVILPVEMRMMRMKAALSGSSIGDDCTR